MAFLTPWNCLSDLLVLLLFYFSPQTAQATELIRSPCINDCILETHHYYDLANYECLCETIWNGSDTIKSFRHCFDRNCSGSKREIPFEAWNNFNVGLDKMCNKKWKGDKPKPQPPLPIPVPNKPPKPEVTFTTATTSKSTTKSKGKPPTPTLTAPASPSQTVKTETRTSTPPVSTSDTSTGSTQTTISSTSSVAVNGTAVRITITVDPTSQTTDSSGAVPLDSKSFIISFVFGGLMMLFVA